MMKIKKMMLEKMSGRTPRYSSIENPPFLSYLIYLACFLPWLRILFAGIFGVRFGFFGTVTVEYGWDAVAIETILLCCIPILPIAVLYQVIFLIWKRKTLSRGQKWAGFVLTLSIAGSLFLSCQICEVMTENHEEQIYRQDKQRIEAYLRETFGEECAAEMKVRKPYGVSLYYQVETPMMESTFLVCLDEERQAVDSSYFCQTYTKDFNLEALLSQKLAKNYDIPETTGLGVRIDAFPVQKAFEQDIDGLLEQCDFVLTFVSLQMDCYDRQEAIQEIGRFYTGYGKELLAYREAPALSFYIKGENENYARILVVPSEKNPNACHLKFYGFTEKQEMKSVPYEEMDILLP